jgi:hypothetical protein
MRSHSPTLCPENDVGNHPQSSARAYSKEKSAGWVKEVSSMGEIPFLR